MFRNLVFLLALAVTGLGSAQATGLIMPIYGNTSSQFNAAIAAARKVQTVVILNPDDGPGSRKDTFIAGYVSKLKSAGAIVIGYISTQYGGVSTSRVQSQMNAYISYYGIQGYFLDEMSDSSSKLGYYKTLKAYAAGKGKYVVGNPGTTVPSSYAATADLLITYEDPYSAGWTRSKPPSWAAGKPSKIGAIVYSTNSSLMNGVIDRAIALGYGWVFVTDRGGADPFGIAPSYLSSERDYLARKNAAAPVVK